MFGSEKEKGTSLFFIYYGCTNVFVCFFFQDSKVKDENVGTEDVGKKCFSLVKKFVHFDNVCETLYY